MVVLGFSGISNGALYREKYGLRFVGHDAAVALIQDGKVLFAAEEERFCREKHTSRLPVLALEACFRHTGLSDSDIDHLAYTWSVTPGKYLAMCVHHVPHVPIRHAPAMVTTGLRVVHDLMSPGRIGRSFAKAVGTPLPACQGMDHHLAHAATAYFASPFGKAAVLTIDGQGEDQSASLGEWEGTRYRKIMKISSPNSIGILYGMVTDFIGMRAGWDEYKVMAMAAEGDPARFRAAFRKLVRLLPNGRYETWRTAMVFMPGYCSAFLTRLLGIPARRPDEPISQDHFDLAATLQETTREVVFHLLKHLRSQTRSVSLCVAGGVALNSVINGEVLRSGLFEQVFIPPVPGDHGGAFGAAMAVYYQESAAPRQASDFTAFLGPEASDTEIAQALAPHALSLTWTQPTDLSAALAALLADEKIVACCYGRMEYGPRALGHRSLLASPVERSMRDTLNARVKHREPFRPFAAIVPREDAPRLFQIAADSPYMQFVVPVKTEWLGRLGAVHHHERTRVQTVDSQVDPFLHSVLKAFERLRGVPALLNTSFNDADEPIVCTASDAVRAFLHTDVDALVLGRVLVLRRPA